MSKSIAVIGLGFGDEGKGMVTSSLCAQSRNPLVIRFSGGHQAGHTVVENGITHTFANFGSGTFQGIPTYWSPNCTVEPIGLLNELNVLVDKMQDDIDNVRIYIDNDCPVTTPYDMIYSRQRDRDLMHGSCGVGFGATFEREEDHIHLKFKDLFNPTVLKIKLELIRKHYNMFINETTPRSQEEFMEAVNLLSVKSMLPHNLIIPVNKMPRRFDTYIYEGSQGLLLDQNIGFFPHVTRSSVGTGKLSHNAAIDEVYYVTRAYQTRHGEGPMTNEEIVLQIGSTPEESNTENPYQGRFRRSVLDLDLLKYALEHDRKERIGDPREKLVVTCLDQLSSYQHTHNGHLSTAMHVDGFIKAIVDTLKFKDNIYLSRSVESEINEWKGGTL